MTESSSSSTSTSTCPSFSIKLATFFTQKLKKMELVSLKKGTFFHFKVDENEKGLCENNQVEMGYFEIVETQVELGV